MTVAFVFCAIFTYGFCWYLPQDVEYPVILKKRVVTPDRLSHTEENASSQTRRQEFMRSMWSSPVIAATLLFGIFACGFGGLHCLAWNSPFPTSKERLAWRICSVATTVLPLLSTPVFLGIVDSPMKDSYTLPLDWFTRTFYTLARTTIIVLAFTALRALPADTFQTVNWDNYFPHFAT